VKAKNLFYASVSLVLLAVAYSIGARNAAACLEPASTPGLVGFVGGATVLRSDWTWWTMRHRPDLGPDVVEWNTVEGLPNSPPPVPLEQIALCSFGATAFVTTSGEGWLWGGSTNQRWLPAGPIPTNPVSTTSSSWSRMKNDYRR